MVVQACKFQFPLAFHSIRAEKKFEPSHFFGVCLCLGGDVCFWFVCSFCLCVFGVCVWGGGPSQEVWGAVKLFTLVICDFPKSRRVGADGAGNGGKVEVGRW